MRHLCWPAASRPCSPPPLSVPTVTRTASPGSFASSRGGIPTNTCVACPRFERPIPTPPQDAPEIHLIKSCYNKVGKVNSMHVLSQWELVIGVSACTSTLIHLGKASSGQHSTLSMDWCDQMLSDGVRPKFQLSTFYNASGQWSVHRTGMRICWANHEEGFRLSEIRRIHLYSDLDSASAVFCWIMDWWLMVGGGGLFLSQIAIYTRF